MTPEPPTTANAPRRCCSYALAALVLMVAAMGCAAPNGSVVAGESGAGQSSAEGSQSAVERRPRPAGDASGTNVVFLIGDGMGVAQLSAAIWASEARLAFERMPVVGLHKNASSDNLVTDSAAGATAFACGIKTYNGAIGVDADGRACETILETAAARGMPTGLIATSTIVHATPAAFFAHEASRSSYENIARQLLDAPVDFFVGGGITFFDNRESDTRMLLAEMRAGGRVVETLVDRELTQQTPDPRRPFGFLTASRDPLPVLQGRAYLPDATAMALDYLHARDTAGRGFFLMIEGSQIDWGGHANNGPYIVSEVHDFSRALDRVLNWAEGHPNTLVVVTADHETGGFAVNNGSRADSLVYAFTSDYHTAALVPVLASGVGATTFAGIYQNTSIYDKLLEVMTAPPAPSN